MSPNVMDWVQMPLFAWDGKQIKRIKTDNFEVYRRFPAEELRSAESGETQPHIQGLISNFWYLGADEIKHAANFKTENYKR